MEVVRRILLYAQHTAIPKPEDFLIFIQKISVVLTIIANSPRTILEYFWQSQIHPSITQNLCQSLIHCHKPIVGLFLKITKISVFYH